MSEVKVTKANVLAAIENYFNGMDLNTVIGDGITAANAIDYAVNEQNHLADKAAKAKAKAAEKRAEGDALQDAVLAALGDEFEPIAVIAERVDGEDVTVAKVTYRLGALVKAGKAEKAEIKVNAEGEKTRKIMGYKAVAVDAEQATEGYVE